MAFYNKTATQAMSQRSDVDTFTHKFGAYVSNSRQYRRRISSPMPIHPNMQGTAFYNFNSDSYDEPFVEVHLPASSFDHLVAVSRMEDADFQHRQHAAEVLKQHRADEWVRDNNPAVQKAWKRYLMLLELART